MRIKKEELRRRVKIAYSILKECRLCPWECGVNRLRGQRGICKVGAKPIVSSFGLHFGEERVLVGNRGSGTVFFSGCPMKCIFCQNYIISQLMEGEEISIPTLAKIFLHLKKEGALNLNLVTPTHVVPMILQALYLVYEEMDIPIVYNTGGYDSVKTLELLDGVIDIYMPDVKYGNNENARKYSMVKDYWDVVRIAVKEMQRQVGDLVIENGIAKRGLLVRHLVLPNDIADSKKVLDFLYFEVSPHVHVNIMDQYYPTYKAYKDPAISRRVSFKEYEDVLNYAIKLGLPIVS